MMKKIFLGVLLFAAVLHAEEIYATFTVEAKQNAKLAFNASGVVGKVNVDVGSVVKKGAVLAALKSEDIRARYEIAKTALKYAKRDYERQFKVKQILDKAKLDQVSFKYDNAKAQLLYQKALLDNTVLEAPFDGIITYKNVEVGDTVSSVRLSTVLKIQSLHARKLLLSFDQKYWKVVKPGAVFRYKVDGDDTPREGRISKVYPSADPKDRKMHAEVPVTDIPVGLFGTGEIIVNPKKQ